MTGWTDEEFYAYDFAYGTVDPQFALFIQQEIERLTGYSIETMVVPNIAFQLAVRQDMWEDSYNGGYARPVPDALSLLSLNADVLDPSAGGNWDVLGGVVDDPLASRVFVSGEVFLAYTSLLDLGSLFPDLLYGRVQLTPEYQQIVRDVLSTNFWGEENYP